MKIKYNKYIIPLAVTIVVIIVLIASWLVINRIKDKKKEDTHLYLSTILETTHQSLNNWIKNDKNNVEVWAKEMLPATKELLKIPHKPENLISSPTQSKIRKTLRPLYQKNDYEGFFIIGPGNINLASSRDINIGIINLLFEQEDILERMWLGETVLSTPIISDVPLPDKMGNLQKNRATMFIGTPIKDKYGNVIALFTLRINPGKDFNAIFERARIGKSGETYGVDKFGRMISFSRFPDQLEKLGVIKPGENEILQIKVANPGVNLMKGEKRTISADSLPLTLMAKSLVKYNSGSNLDGYLNYRGVPVIGMWSWNDEFGFGTAIEIDKQEAYETFYFIRFSLIVLTVFIIALLIGLAYLYVWLTKNISKRKAEYKSLFDNSPLGIYQTKPDGTITRANATLLKMLEYDSLHDLQKRDLNKEGYSKQSSVSRQQFIEMIERDGVVKGLEESWATKTGKIIPIRENARVIRGSNGEVLFYEGTVEDITERKKTEEEIYRLSKHNELILNSIGEGIYGLDLEGVITFANPSAATMLGSSVKELIGEQAHDNHHHRKPDGSLYPREKCPVYAAFKTGVKSQVDNEVFWRKDGTSFQVYYTSTPIKNDIGELVGSVVVFKDTTERKRAEKKIIDLNENLENRVNQRTSELQQTKKRLEYLLTSAPVVIYTSEIKHPFGITYIGDNVLQMMGYEPKHFLGNPDFWASKIHPDDVKEIFAKLSHIFEKDNLKLEYRFLLNDGTYRWILDELLVIKDENGKPSELLGYWIDINNRKENEDRIQQTLKEISDYKIALDESSIVAITDQRGIINYVNDNFCKISKYTQDELIGQDHRVINSGFHSKEFFRDLWTTIAHGQIWRGEIKNKAKDGSFYWVHTVIVPFLNKKGKPYQYVTIRRDITEEKLLNEELIKAKKAADAANRAKSEFLANMSHEIRTPMNAIIGFSELLYNNTEGEKQRSQIASIHTSGKNLLKIINDILDLSKIEAGKLTIQKETVNIHQLAKDMEMVFSHKADEKGISFYIETESQIPSALLLDETRLRQVLFNLLGNAVKFTDKGHVILTLDKKTKTNNTIDLIIKVEDTGIGIPKAQQDKVFEAFNQQEGQINSKYGGTGLGLSITKRLVNIMGGGIDIDSEPGKGSIFTVCLPNVKIDVLENIVSDKITFVPTSVNFKEAKVLIADDNSENRNLIIDLLESSLLTLFEAKNGKEAVKIATKHLPDLILMDLRMPLMNGYEAINILKNQESTKSIPVIAISASIKILSKTNQFKDTFDDFLMKPVNLEELVQLLKKYLKYEINKNQAIIGKEKPKKMKFETSKELQKKLPELIHTLENEFMPVYNKVVETQMIDRIEKFGKDLAVLGEKYNAEMIYNYADEICRLVDNFEIDKLIESLNNFPQIIEQHKSLINNY